MPSAMHLSVEYRIERRKRGSQRKSNPTGEDSVLSRIARNDVEANRIRLLNLKVIELDVSLAAHGIRNGSTSLAIKCSNRVVVSGKNLNLAVIYRHATRRIICGTRICDFSKKSKVQAAMLTLLFLNAAKICGSAEGEEEEQRAGSVVGCGGWDVEVEERRVDR